MNTKQVAGWLREAAASINYWSNGEGDRFKQRAAQVEAMTCDGCKHWGRIKRTDNGSRVCGSPYVINVAAPKPYSIQSEDAIFFGPKFGCIHWEKK